MSLPLRRGQINGTKPCALTCIEHTASGVFLDNGIKLLPAGKYSRSSITHCTGTSICDTNTRTQSGEEKKVALDTPLCMSRLLKAF